MRDPTEKEIFQKKLELLTGKITQATKKKDDDDDLDPYKDPSKLLELTVLRMTFMDLGPRVDCLDLFENLQTLYLHNNLLNEMTQTTFQFNMHLRDLNLSHNKFIRLNGALCHLMKLNFLDISFNSIEDLEV